MEENFVYEFFIKPIISPEVQGYNLVNTSIYILLLVLACIGLYYLLNKKIKFDEKFFFSLIPYILFGVLMRVLMHQIETGNLLIEGIAKTANPLEFGFWFFTPGIWLLTFFMVAIGLVFSGILRKKEINNKRLFLFGAIFATPLLLFNLSRFNNWFAFILTTILIVLVAYICLLAINKFTKYKILSQPLNIFIVTGQAIDGIASIIAISFFGFSEQHVFSSMLININPLLFAGLKIILGILIAWSLDDYLKETKTKNKSKENLVNFVKVVIAILGFATGLASLFKLGLI